MHTTTPLCPWLDRRGRSLSSSWPLEVSLNQLGPGRRFVMGHNNSKNSRDAPKFTRSDTAASTRSARSARSGKSGRSSMSRRTSESDRNEGVPAASAGSAGGANLQVPGRTVYSRSNSSHSIGTPASRHRDSTNTRDSDYFMSLPKSLQVHEPRDSILVRNGSTPGGGSSAVATPLSPERPGKVAEDELGELPFGMSPRNPGAPTIGQGQLNIDDLIQLLLDAGYAGKRTRNFCLKSSEIAVICQAASEIFLSQPALLELQPPVKIVGDVHGQYGDLLRMFSMCGFPPQANYLFLGDYVDRGKQSLETIVLLLLYKIKYPENFFILRGNHESANITRMYGFYDECKRRSSVKTWRTFIDCFNTLPIAAVVAGKIFCVHGGLSPSLTSVEDIRNIERPTDVPEYGLLNDLLWSDPTDGPNEWEDNERGASYCFNKVAINKFIQRFNYDLVCRAHMVVEDGYEFFNDHTLVTVFSAPNYCGEFDNWGAVMSVSEELLCSFELLKPLDSAELKEEMRKEKQERKSAQSPA